jgi:hypothetical protein
MVTGSAVVFGVVGAVEIVKVTSLVPEEVNVTAFEG